ncbi:hypothetical protein HN51_010159 [Arachis hypogaea]|uniref:BHLH domain-containing protein n=1 Tax=Arachis hypogaea TaxID=3818 RepID=A0A445E409_ARAHY|nr:transcription factor bHLH122 [Arachis hypogaea]XP_025686278.1 transcription factor bHLH122 [Arachis hypogaea]QHO55179.1 Transcription factor [Arachis hypogaea]QHO55180.1 Transcription factor [Arachis hypogaea]RYR70174.1 hypothetical protein Ahy_A03g016685 [Arachis hypogaea]
MESDLHRHPPMFLDHHHHHHHHHHHQQMNTTTTNNNNNSSGLTRFRSAPSSYFSSIIDKEFYESIFNKPSSPETEKILARFMNSLANDEPEDDSLLGVAAATSPTTNNNKNLSPSPQPPQQVVQQISQVKEEEISINTINTNNTLQPQPLPSSMNNESLVQQPQQQMNSMSNNNYGSLSGNNPPTQSFYQSSGRPPLPNQMKTGRGNASNLIRHGRSPAGLFSNLNLEGYAALRGMGTMGAAASNTSEDANFSPVARLKNPPTFSSSGLMTPIAEIRSTSNTLNNPESAEAFAESQSSDFMSGLPIGSWDDSSSSMMSDNIAGRKRFRDEDVKPFAGVNAADTQVKTEAGQAPGTPLAHQLSMPNTSSEIAAIEKFLQCSDSVVCKIRAKRGCATHPRSIAERVRRTKISERMRKLQDLVPNMDKQTNTADMLDLAVDYIKELQNQVETLSESQAKCTCAHKKQQ